MAVPFPQVHPGETITEQEAEQRLVTDMQTAVTVINALVKVAITQGQFDAMVDFVFNEGQGHFATSTLLKKLNAGDFAGAAAQCLVWDEAGGQIEPGLLRRRQAEAAMFTG
jgi:lysozyme